MFDIAWSEILLTAIVALIFIGPKELPAVLFKLGKMLAKARLVAEGYRRQFEASMREAGLDEVHRSIQDFKSLHPANQIKDTLSKAMGPEPFTPPPTPMNTAAATAYTAHEVDQRLKDEQAAGAEAAKVGALVQSDPGEAAQTLPASQSATQTLSAPHTQSAPVG